MTDATHKTESVFKILTSSEWESFVAKGEFDGSPVDKSDGFIHLSTASQMQGTLDKYYTTGEDIIIAEIDMARIKDSVKWEVSRGGAEFPHQYGVLKKDDILSHWVLSPDTAGRYKFSEA